MGRVIAKRGAELEWFHNRHREEADGTRTLTMRSKFYFNPAREPAMLRYVEYLPGCTEPRHSHTEDEVVFITAGEMDIEGTIYRAGDALWIEAKTEYGPLVAGPEGATFLLFRKGIADYVPKPGDSQPRRG